jgi:REP element-mobilizing transposase RayT
MPRQARIDIPGYLYHVIARGIERRKIFIDGKDYEEFLLRLEKALDKTGSKCCAFSLLPNHFHLLILRGIRPLAELMRRLMTGYAVYFNLRRKRAGHLFQNRYKAILCDRDSYFLELVAYIHLNPLRAGLVQDLGALERYKWCGHRAVIGKNAVGYLAKEEILQHFGTHAKGARKKYVTYVKGRVNKFKSGELSGGLIRSKGGLSEIVGMSKEEGKEEFDERILGDGDFVASVLKESNEQMQRGKKMSSDAVIKAVVEATGIYREDICSRSQNRQVVKARALYCYLAKERCGMSGAQLMQQLGMTSGAISHLVSKGKDLDRRPLSL